MTQLAFKTTNQNELYGITNFQQPDVGFHNPHFESWDHYLSLDDAHERSDNVYTELDFSQSEV